MNEIKFVAGMGLFEFCQEVDKAYKEGYVFDFEKSERVPSSYGSLFEATLVKPSESVVQSDEQAKTRGRPPKS